MSEALQDTDWITISRFLKLGIEEARPLIKSLAMLYIKSTSEHDCSIAKNIAVHGLCLRIIEGEKISPHDLEFLVNALQYRMFRIISQAYSYKSAIGAPLGSFPWCHEAENYHLVSQLKKDPVAIERYSEISNMIFEKDFALFDRSGTGAGHVYRRGSMYLALALEYTKWSMEVIKQALEDLALLKGDSSDIGSTVKSLKLSEHETVRKQLKEIAMSCERKLRDSDN